MYSASFPARIWAESPGNMRGMGTFRGAAGADQCVQAVAASIAATSPSAIRLPIVAPFYPRTLACIPSVSAGQAAEKA